MKKVKIAELKDKLSEHLRAVENGAEVVVTDRDRPIARIVPFSAHERTKLTIVAPKLPLSTLHGRRWQRSAWSIKSGALLDGERSER